MSIEERAARKWLSLRDSARDRGLEFNLSLLSLVNLYGAKRCFYTGVELRLQKGHDNSLTLDRVDNNLGYVRGNVVACSQRFNSRKGEITAEDVSMLLRAFKKKGVS